MPLKTRIKYLLCKSWFSLWGVSPIKCPEVWKSPLDFTFPSCQMLPQKCGFSETPQGVNITHVKLGNTRENLNLIEVLILLQFFFGKKNIPTQSPHHPFTGNKKKNGVPCCQHPKKNSTTFFFWLSSPGDTLVWTVSTSAFPSVFSMV